MDFDTKEQIDELKANIEDAKKDKIPWNTLVSITKIFSSTLERSNYLNSILLNELKEYKINQTDLRNENQRLKEIARIAEELVKASAKAVEGKAFLTIFCVEYLILKLFHYFVHWHFDEKS